MRFTVLVLLCVSITASMISCTESEPEIEEVDVTESAAPEPATSILEGISYGDIDSAGVAENDAKIRKIVQNFRAYSETKKRDIRGAIPDDQLRMLISYSHYMIEEGVNEGVESKVRDGLHAVALIPPYYDKHKQSKTLVFMARYAMDRLGMDEEAEKELFFNVYGSSGERTFSAVFVGDADNIHGSAFYDLSIKVKNGEVDFERKR